MSTRTESGWQLVGDAPAAYEAYLVPAIFDRMSRRMVATAGVAPGHRVLDVACGTGVVARAAAAAVGPTGAVTGIDLNPDMLATAADAAAGVTPTIEWRRGDAAALPFGDDAFDTVLCEEALQFFTERVAALREMRRVAAPDGRVCFSVFRSLDHNPVYVHFAELLATYAGPEAATMMQSPFALGDADILRDDAAAAGLRDVRVRIAVNEERFPSVEEMVRREAASSPLAGPLSALDPTARSELVASLQTALAAHVDDFGVAFSNETHLVTARA